MMPNIMSHVKIVFPQKMKLDGKDISIVDDSLGKVEKVLVESDIEFRVADKKYNTYTWCNHQL